MPGFNSSKQLVFVTNGCQASEKCIRSYAICIQPRRCKDGSSALCSLSKGFPWQADNSKWQREVTVYSRNLCIIRKTAQSTPVFANPSSNCFMPTDTKGMRKKKKKVVMRPQSSHSLLFVFFFFFLLLL